MLLVRRLGICLLGSAAGLFAVAALMAFVFVLAGLHSPPAFFPGRLLASSGFFGVLLYGALPAAAGGVAYALVTARWPLGWVSVGALGAVLGSLVAVFDVPLFFFGLPAGVVAATVAHALVRNRLSPNNSSKPTPLRGAA